MELAMNSSDEGRSSDSEAEDKQPAPEPVKPRRVQQVILPPGGNSSDAGGGEEPEREARKPRPMELAMNSSDQGSSSDSEGQAEQPAPEPVKPRVKRRAVPDHLDSGLVSPTGLPLVVNSSEQRPKTAEQLADAEELAERQRGRSGRRGSVVQFAGRRAAMSVEAELEATLTRLRRARDSNDANEMQSALIAAAPAAMMSGPLASEVQSIAMAIAARLASDEDLVRAGTLRKSGRIRGKVRRLWQLMVVETLLQASEDERTTESQRLIDVRHAQHDATTERAQGTEGDVSKAGYLMLHMRVAKVLIPPGAVNPDGIPVEFHTAEAREMAEADWDADVARFSGSSHIMGWIDTIRTKFKVASSRVVMEHGFSVLFEQLDTDGSGELDREEFASAVRTELGISERDISDTEVSNIFRAVDADQSGSICASEFVSWLCGDESEEAKRALAASPRSNPVREKLKLLAEERTQATGWSSIFDKYDFDHSGELELGEFTAAVRGECNLKESQMSDNDLEELFAVVDADESGAIDAAELCVLLTADLATPSMTFGPFHASLFELMTLWVPEETEEAYCNFLQQLFEAISMPVNGHTTDEDLSAVPVFDAIDGKTPNFRLRDLDACARLLDGNGALRNNAAGVCDNAAGVSVHTEDQPASPVVMTPRDRPDRGGRRQRALTRHISSTMMHSVDRERSSKNLLEHHLTAFALSPHRPSYKPGDWNVNNALLQSTQFMSAEREAELDEEMDAFRGRHLQLMKVRAKAATAATSSNRPTTAEDLSRHRSNSSLAKAVATAIPQHHADGDDRKPGVESSAPPAPQRIVLQAHTGQRVELDVESNVRVLDPSVIQPRVQGCGRQQLKAMQSPRQRLQQQQERIPTRPSHCCATPARPRTTTPRARKESTTTRVREHAYPAGMMRRPHTARELCGTTARAAAALLPNNVADRTPSRQRPWGAGFQQQPRQVTTARQLASPARGTVRLRPRAVTSSHLAVAMGCERVVSGVAVALGSDWDGARRRQNASPRRKGVAPLPFVPRTCPPTIRTRTRRLVAGCF